MTSRVTVGNRSRRTGHDKGYSPVVTHRGFELTAPGEGRANLVLTIGFAVVWTAAIIGMVVLAFNLQEKVMWIFTGVFALSEVLIVVMVAKVVRVRTSWSESRLILDAWPLQLGSQASGWFSRPLAKTTETPQPTSAKLIVRESATYRVGTDTRTATEDIATTDLVLAPANIDGVGGYRFAVSIGPQGPPTIQLDANLVEWFIEFTMDAPEAPETCSMFTVLVSPEHGARR